MIAKSENAEKRPAAIFEWFANVAANATIVAT
jgi:hypothetical protein